jgi:predicted nucleic acid-binding protein
MKELTPVQETCVYSTFENDVSQGYLLMYAMNESIYDNAKHILTTLNHVPLRTLDALHLAVVQFHGIKALATADFNMRHAAEEMKIGVAFF